MKTIETEATAEAREKMRQRVFEEIRAAGTVPDEEYIEALAFGIADSIAARNSTMKVFEELIQLQANRLTAINGLNQIESIIPPAAVQRLLDGIGLPAPIAVAKATTAGKPN